MAADGTIRPLIGITKVVGLTIERTPRIRYCRLDNTGFNFIDFTVVPEQDDSNYCPLNISGFYNFDTSPS